MLSVVKKQLAQQRKQQQLRQQQQQLTSMPPTQPSTASSAQPTTAKQRAKRTRTSTAAGGGNVLSIFDQARAAREQVDYLSSNVAYLTRTSARLLQIRQLHHQLSQRSHSGRKRRKSEQAGSTRAASERDDYDEMNAGDDAHD